MGVGKGVFKEEKQSKDRVIEDTIFSKSGQERPP